MKQLDVKSLKRIIIDVRPNSGGNEALAREVAATFVAKPSVYARRATLKDGKFEPAREVTIVPTPGAAPFKGSVVVLVGPKNMSTTESFVLMLKHGANARVVGEKTYGASGNPLALRLSNGVEVFLPSWKMMTPDGAALEGVGIAPDLAVTMSPEELRGEDRVLKKAIEALQTQRLP